MKQECRKWVAVGAGRWLHNGQVVFTLLCVYLKMSIINVNKINMCLLWNSRLSPGDCWFMVRSMFSSLKWMQWHLPSQDLFGDFHVPLLYVLCAGYTRRKVPTPMELMDWWERQMLSRHLPRDAFNSNVVSAAKDNQARLGERITGRFDPDLDKGFPVFSDI